MMIQRRLTISRANRLLKAQQLTCQQLCQHSYNLATFGEHSLYLNAYLKILSLDDILHQATLSNERICNGQPKSVLDGIPVTIKANIAVGKWWMMPNSASTILNYYGQGDDNNNNSNSVSISGEEEGIHYESDIARKLLKECGAVLIGITNMDEFGMGSLGINSGLLPMIHNNNSDHQHQCSPIYNPLPWMHRLSILQHQQQLSQSHQQIISLDSSINNEDRHWIDQIQNSTIHNPHGIDNHDALEELLNEVRYWTQPQQSKHHHNDDNVDNANENNTSSSQSYSSSSSSPLLSSGGSSSGAAATIAHGSSLLSIGTDTGGSLRLPAAWTNTVGFKPTYGTFSRYGVVSYASSLDTVGFVAGSVECARMVWECLSSSSSSSGGGGGCDDDKKEIESDNDNNHDDERKSCFDASKCRDVTARVYHDDRYGLALQQQHVNSSNNVDMKKPLANIRIGIPNAFSLYETPPLISNAWCAAANILQNDSGATLVAIPESLLSSEWIKLSCAAYYVLACAEASSNLSRYDGVRFGMDVNLSEFANLDSEQGYEAFHPLSGMTTLEEKISITRVLGFGYEVQRRVLTGTSVLSSDRFHTHYEAAAIARAKVSQSIERVFRSSSTIVEENDNVDVMLVPTAISFPCTLNPKLGDRIMEDMDPTAAFGNDVMTIPISLGGFPSISVPYSTHTYNDDGNYSARQEKDVVGLQVFGMRGSEDIVLQVAENIIMNTSF